VRNKDIYKNYNPDILETIANLSNDEVFTPPKLANKILDLLPQEIWKDSSVTFLDPACKTGIFLREITSRLIEGLAEEIPDLQERVNHILTKQVFGIGITELTTLMSRRTLYCSMYANGEHSVCTEFDNPEGNIVFPDTEHTWDKNGRCEYCGANEENYSGGANKENHAYPFIHDNFKKEFGNMKFDVIIGNPPYQLNVGNEGGNSAKAKAIYHLFIDKAIDMNPNYISMITPSRWMSGQPEGIPKSWIENMLNDKRIQEIHDFKKSTECFSNVNIRGGVNYFLWNSKYKGKVLFHEYNGDEINKAKVNLNYDGSNIAVRNISSLSIIEKIKKKEGNYVSNGTNFSSLVSPKDFFTRRPKLTSSWNGFSLSKDDKKTIKYYMSKHLTGENIGWISEDDVLKNKSTMKKHKVYIPSVGDPEEFGLVLGHPMYGEPNSACSQTYLVIGYKNKQNFTKKQCENIISYIESKLFRFMVKVKMNTGISAARGVYQFVPLQDFSKPWTDE